MAKSYYYQAAQQIEKDVLINFKKLDFLAMMTRTLLELYVVVQDHPWSKLYFLLFLSMVMYANKLQTKENTI